MYEEEYMALVLAAFDRDKDNDNLSQELVSPTAGNLKAEAVKVCARRFDPKDVTVLGSFIKADPDKDAYYRAINNCNYQIFRPLSTFLNNRHKETAFKNIQLLAWLIDFRPRPFNAKLRPEDFILQTSKSGIPDRSDNINSADQSDQAGRSGHEKENKGNGDKPEIDDKGEGKKPLINIRFQWMIGVAALLLTGAIYWMIIKVSEPCMYWHDDHYIATSCDVSKADTPLIAFDRAKLESFRKIKRTDTLTRNSIDKLWWTRVGDTVEIYTAGGNHPLFPDKKLRKVTDYVVNVCQNRGKSK